MITYTCDGSGREIPAKSLRYKVKIDVRAAYDEITVGLMELVRDPRTEMLALIERMKNKDPDQIEESIYKGIDLDLCPTCQKAFIQSPLRFHPEQGGAHDAIDIDGFLRSLGMGGGPPPTEE